MLEDLKYKILVRWLEIPTYKRRELKETMHIVSVLTIIFVLSVSFGFAMMEIK